MHRAPFFELVVPAVSASPEISVSIAVHQSLREVAASAAKFV